VCRRSGGQSASGAAGDAAIGAGAATMTAAEAMSAPALGAKGASINSSKTIRRSSAIETVAYANKRVAKGWFDTVIVLDTTYDCQYIIGQLA
jgi:hypothetical protein